MYIDVKKGVKKVKDDSIIFKTFGVLAIILLIPFLLCDGISKIVFGVLLTLDILFILTILFMCFVTRGSKKESNAYRVGIETLQYANKDFVREFCRWYIEWQNIIIGNHAVDSKVAMYLAINLHITQLPDMSVFEKCQELFLSGKEIATNDRYKLLELAQKLDKCTKDAERDSIKKQIIDVMQGY